MIKILCFGTFDGVHDGHRAMLKEARILPFQKGVPPKAGLPASGGEGFRDSNKSLTTRLDSPVGRGRARGPLPFTKGEYLVVAVAPDSVVTTLKGKHPRHTQAERIQMVKNEYLVDEVILADGTVDEWKILKKVKPQVVALGYDQHELRASLEAFLETAYPEVETESGEWIKNPKRPTIIVLSAHKPDKLHNTIIYNSQFPINF